MKLKGKQKILFKNYNNSTKVKDNEMQIAGAITTGEAKFGSIMYRGDIRENIEKLSKLGYEGVEISLRDPKIIKKKELKEALKKIV